MSLELLSKVNNRFHMAVAIHRDLSDLFWFVSLRGYAALHEKQAVEESLTQRKIKRYIISTYDTISPDKLPQNANVVGQFLTDKNRNKIQSKDIQEITKNAWFEYENWETDTLKEYQEISAKLLSNGDVDAFNFLSEIIKDVREELNILTNKIVELTANGWDMPAITSEQNEIADKYEKLTHKLFKKENDLYATR